MGPLGVPSSLRSSGHRHPTAIRPLGDPRAPDQWPRHRSGGVFSPTHPRAARPSPTQRHPGGMKRSTHAAGPIRCVAREDSTPGRPDRTRPPSLGEASCSQVSWTPQCRLGDFRRAAGEPMVSRSPRAGHLRPHSLTDAMRLECDEYGHCQDKQHQRHWRLRNDGRDEQQSGNVANAVHCRADEPRAVGWQGRTTLSEGLRVSNGCAGGAFTGNARSACGEARICRHRTQRSRTGPSRITLSAQYRMTDARQRKPEGGFQS